MSAATLILKQGELTELMKAARLGDLQAVRKFAETEQGFVSQEGFTALGYALMAGKKQTAAELSRFGSEWYNMADERKLQLVSAFVSLE